MVKVTGIRRPNRAEEDWLAGDMPLYLGAHELAEDGAKLDADGREGAERPD
jgi:hypothetical protein